LHSRILLPTILLLILILTSAIFLFPIHVECEYYPLEALYLFNNLPLFSSLYLSWLSLIFALVLINERQRRNWEKPILACIFALVFIGFWVVIAPYGATGDSIWLAAHVEHILEEGNISVECQALTYNDFPALQVLAASLSEICALSPLKTANLFLLLNILLTSGSLYVLYKKSLGNDFLAFLAILLVVEGSIAIPERMRIFYPSVLGFTFIVTLMVLLSRSKGNPLDSSQDKLLFILLVTTAVITHAQTGLLFSLILGSLWILQRFSRTSFALSLVPLPLILFFGWEMFWAARSFIGFTNLFSKTAQDLFSMETYSAVFRLGEANIRGDLPAWASFTRLFWWALIFGFGSLLALARLFKIDKLESLQRIEIGGLVGVSTLIIISIFAGAGGFQFVKFPFYAAIFCVPILLRFLHNIRVGGMVRLSHLLILALFTLSLPSFLCSVNHPNTDMVYAQQYYSAKFLNPASNNKGANLEVMADGTTYGALAYHVPNALLINIQRHPWEVTEEEEWQRLNKLVDWFRRSGATMERRAILVWSKSLPIPYQYIMGINPRHAGWINLKEKLSLNDKFYDNGFVELYGSWLLA